MLNGKEEIEGLITVNGHHTRKPRRIVFPGLRLGHTLVLQYGLDDQARPPFDTEFVVHVGEEEVHRDRLRAQGLKEVRIPTEKWSGDGVLTDVVVEVRTTRRQRSRFAFDGWIRGL